LRHAIGQNLGAKTEEAPMARELLQTAAAIRSCGARAALVALAVGLSGGPLSAQASASDPSAGHPVAEHDGAVPQRSEAPLSEGAARLPAATETRHEILIEGQPLRFVATAGALALAASDGKLEAELAYIAYTLEEGDAAERPVTFVVNGGPGAASAYLQLGALGPWAVALGPDRIRPSDAPSLADNPDTWLAFTDLVFIDPVGAGFSRLASGDDRVRERYLSVEGDIEALAQAILRWTLENGRLGSPRYFVGESYGGFRGPLLAEELLTGHGLALSGLVLVSPVLDFGWWEQPSHAPLPRASLLPSLAASALEAGGAFSEAALADAEAYAGGPYVADLLRGVGDRAAVDRLVDRVTDLTGSTGRPSRRRTGGSTCRRSRAASPVPTRGC
jgi:carboxypeptidase C (cathepsin A)